MQKRISSTKDTIVANRIVNSAVEGVLYLEETRQTEKEFGLPGVYAYSSRFLDFEQYLTFIDETIFTLCLSIFAVEIIILVITSDLTVTMLVGVNVLLTDMYIIALVYFWGLTLNPLVIVNVIVAMGTSVDFSAHIAYAYLVEKVPRKHAHSKESIRSYKA